MGIEKTDSGISILVTEFNPERTKTIKSFSCIERYFFERSIDAAIEYTVNKIMSMRKEKESKDELDGKNEGMGWC